MPIRNNSVVIPKPSDGIERAKLALDEEFIFEDDFVYPATADLVAPGTPWRDNTGGGGGSVIIPATTGNYGVAQVVTGAGGANTAEMAWKAPGAAYAILDVSHGFNAWFRFQMNAITTCQYRLGLWAAANSFAELSFDPTASAFFQFLSNDTTGLTTTTSNVRAAASIWYLLHIYVSHRNRQVRSVLWSREGNLPAGVSAQGGGHVVANTDALAPRFYAAETAAASRILSVDAIRIAVPRYVPA